ATGGRAAAVVFMPGAPGCVIERLFGAAAFGAVAVGAGCEYVFEPREPALTRGRASASAATSANTAATASTAKSGRKSFIGLSQQPRLRGVRNIGTGGCFVKGSALRPDRAAAPPGMGRNGLGSGGAGQKTPRKTHKSKGGDPCGPFWRSWH